MTKGADLPIGKEAIGKKKSHNPILVTGNSDYILIVDLTEKNNHKSLVRYNNNTGNPRYWKIEKIV